MQRRLRRQSGFSIVEVLVGALVGGAVLTAAGAVMVISLKSSTRVNDKVNSASQGRLASELVQQRLRSQTCLFSQEFTVNGSQPPSGGQRSFVHASPTRVMFVGDITDQGGATNVAGSVGFRPQLRYLWFDPGPTTGEFAGRKGKLIEGWRDTSNSTIPFNFNLSPLTSASAMDEMATVANAESVAPDSRTVLAEGVTNEVTDPGGQPIPIIRYFDALGSEISQVSGAIPVASLGDVNRVNVTFRILGESGRDEIDLGGGEKTDRRTASYSTDAYLRVNADGCT